MAMDIKLPKTVYAHGFITIGGAKISKTIGNVITPSDLVDKYQADGLRYFLCREVFYGSDGDFPAEFNEDGSFKKCDILEKRVNADLANNLGNSLNRIVSSILAKNCDGIVPARFEEAEKDFSEYTNDIKDRVANYMDQYEIHNALISIWELVKKLNRYIDSEEPWSLAKKSKEDESLKPYFHGVLYTCLESLRIISILISPYIPEISSRIWSSLGIESELSDQTWDDVVWGKLATGTITKKR